MSSPFSSGDSFTSRIAAAPALLSDRLASQKNEQQRLAKAQRGDTIINPTPRATSTQPVGDRLGAGA